MNCFCYESIESNPELLDLKIFPFIRQFIKDFIKKNPKCNLDNKNMERMVLDVILDESFRSVEFHLSNNRVLLYNEMLTKYYITQ